LAACGGQKLDVGSRSPAPGNAGGSGGFQTAGDAGGAGTGITIPPSFTSSQVNAALANCTQPHGQAVVSSSQSQEAQLIAGAWVACPTQSRGTNAVPMFLPGIAFQPEQQTGPVDASGPAGQWSRLEKDSSGGMSATTGTENQGTWFAQNESEAAVLTNAGDSTGCFAGPVSFETSPRRMYLVADPTMCPGSTASFDLWMVPLE
jgi:hypothetical protein